MITMVDIDNILNNAANTVTNGINKINSSEKMKSAKEFAKKTTTKLIDYGISLKGKFTEFKDSLTEKNE